MLQYLNRYFMNEKYSRRDSLKRSLGSVLEISGIYFVLESVLSKHRELNERGKSRTLAPIGFCLYVVGKSVRYDASLERKL